MLSRATLKIAGLLLAGACGSDGCITPPCSPVHAAVVNVKSSVSGAKVPGAFFTLNGGDAQPCNQGDTTVCLIDAAVGTSQITIGAPGLVSVQKSISFAVSQPSNCGCPTGTTAQLDVTLVPATPGN